MVDEFEPDDYTVIVVDSDEQVRAELTALLRKAGYHVRTFESAEAVLEEIHELPRQAGIITEVKLPGINGLELIARLRQARIAAPTIILTGLGDVATAVRAMRDSVADYLVKPYVERDLIERLQAALLRQSEPHHSGAL